MKLDYKLNKLLNEKLKIIENENYLNYNDMKNNLLEFENITDLLYNNDYENIHYILFECNDKLTNNEIFKLKDLIKKELLKLLNMNNENLINYNNDIINYLNEYHNTNIDNVFLLDNKTDLKCLNIDLIIKHIELLNNDNNIIEINYNTNTNKKIIKYNKYEFIYYILFENIFYNIETLNYTLSLI